MGERVEQPPIEDQSLTPDQKREIEFRSEDPSVSEAERTVRSHDQALEDRKTALAPDIDDLLDEYSAALREAKAAPDDQVLKEHADEILGRLQKRGLLLKRMEQAMPETLTDAAVKGEQRSVKEQQQREEKRQRALERGDKHAREQYCQDYYHFLDLYKTYNDQTLQLLQRLPQEKGFGLLGQLKKVAKEKDGVLEVIDRRGFKLDPSNPDALDLESWKDLLGRMQAWYQEVAGIHLEVKELLEPHKPEQEKG